MTLHRIGLIADIHSHAASAADMPSTVLQAFAGCELILALGDVGASAVLDRLETCAPVQATRGGDDPAHDPRMVEGTRCLTLDGSTIGAVFNLASRERGIVTDPTLQLPSIPASTLMAEVFGRRVDVVAYAATHSPSIVEHDGVLFVNPGSPTLSAAPSVAIIELEGTTKRARIVPISKQPGAPVSGSS